MKRKLLPLLAAIVLGLIIVAACGAPADALLGFDEEERVTLTMIQRVPAGFVGENNPIWEEFGRRTGSRFVLELPPQAEYNARLNIVMASGDIPDIVYNWVPNDAFLRWALDGMFLPLNDYVDRLPMVRQALDDSELYGAYLVNGVLQGIPRLQAPDQQLLLYRGDWLEAAGLGIPETPEEFHIAMRAFTDPAVTGSALTYGTSAFPGGPHAAQFMPAFEIVRDTFPNRQGEYHTEIAQAGYVLMLDWWRDMYAEGIIDQEWYINVGSDDITKFNIGRSGVAYHNIGVGHYIGYTTTNPANTFLLNNPGAKVVWGPFLRDQSHSKTYSHMVAPVWGAFCVNVNVDYDAKMETILRVFNYGWSDSGIRLIQVGWDGLTYDASLSNDRLRTYVRPDGPVGDEMTRNASRYANGFMAFNSRLMDRGPISRGAWGNDAQRTIDTMNEVMALNIRFSILPQYDSWAPGTGAMRTANTEVSTRMAELRTQYICGLIERDDWLNFIETEWIPAWEGYMDVIRSIAPNQEHMSFWDDL